MAGTYEEWLAEQEEADKKIKAQMAGSQKQLFQGQNQGTQPPVSGKVETAPAKWENKDLDPLAQRGTDTGLQYMDPSQGEPRQSSYNWYAQNFLPYFEKPLTEEERARRERAAYISSGITNLGNAIGAFGNMLYASHGAPAQQLAQSPDVDAKVNAFRERADRVRQQYLNGIATTRQGDQKDYADAYNRHLQKVRVNNAAVTAQQNYEAKVAAQELQAQMNQIKAQRLEAQTAGDWARVAKLAAEEDRIRALIPSQVAAWDALTGQRGAAQEAAEALAEQRWRSGYGTTKTVTDSRGRTTTTVTTPNASSPGHVPASTRGSSNAGGGGGQQPSKPKKQEKPKEQKKPKVKGENTRKLGL